MEKRRRFIYGELRIKGSGAKLQASKAEKLASFLYVLRFFMILLYLFYVNIFSESLAMEITSKF